jgi:D-alanyl-lipoteichoic acid acyltransferase DltB (MBOAT superfamily)
VLFNSYQFLLAFLPLTATVYFLLCRGRRAGAAQLWLLAASLFFYGAWNPVFVPLIAASVAFNFLVSRLIAQRREMAAAAKGVLIFGVAGNLLLLGYFKYTDFFVDNVNQVLGSQWPLLHIVLPLGISFFTFTQIAFLVDTWQGRASRPGIVNYALFVSYFPHLLAGPILHHREMMPQFENPGNQRVDFNNLAGGLLLLAFGLAKKVIVADSLAEFADAGFANPGHWSLADAWLVALAYSLQLYFDFSGYTDMAIGISRLFNIRLPINFNTPYRAVSIQDFWGRWHMTLSRFLREYVYIPLGGNRAGTFAIARNTLLTFLLGGLWHGAGWTFVLWGALHGCALVVQRFWRTTGIPLPVWLAWLLTFIFVVVSWVFFRAGSVNDALALLQGMAGLRGTEMPGASAQDIILIAAALLMATLGANSNAIADKRPLTLGSGILAALLLAGGFLSLGRTSPFIYFNF